MGFCLKTNKQTNIKQQQQQQELMKVLDIQGYRIQKKKKFTMCIHDCPEVLIRIPHFEGKTSLYEFGPLFLKIYLCSLFSYQFYLKDFFSEPLYRIEFEVRNTHPHTPTYLYPPHTHKTDF